MEIMFLGLLGAVLFLTQFRFLTLPFYWDTAGFLIPAAQKIAQTGNLLSYFHMTDYPHPFGLPLLAAIPLALSSDPAFWIHGMSVVISWLFLVAAYVVGKRLGGRRVGAALALVLLTNPLFLAQTHLVYLEIASTFVRWVALGALFYGRSRLFLVIALLSVLVREDNGFMLIVAGGLYAFFAPSIKRKLLWGATHLLPIGAASIGWFVIHRLTSGWWFYSPARYFVEDYWGAFREAISYAVFSQGRWVAALMGIAAWAWIIRKRKRLGFSHEKRAMGIALGAVSLLPFVLIFGLGHFLPRYIFPALPFLALMILVMLATSVGKRHVLFAGATILIVVAQIVSRHECHAGNLEDCATVTTLISQKAQAAQFLWRVASEKTIAASFSENAELTIAAAGAVPEPLTIVPLEGPDAPDYIYVTPTSDAGLTDFVVEHGYRVLRVFLVPAATANIIIYEKP